MLHFNIIIFIIADINSEELPTYAQRLARAEKNTSEINVMSVDDELTDRLSVDPVGTKSQTSKESTSVSCNNGKESANSDNKNMLHVRNEITNVVPCKKAKLLRLERKQNKLLAQGKSESEVANIIREKKQQKQQNSVKTLEELFDEVHNGLKKLEVIQYRQSKFIYSAIIRFTRRSLIFAWHEIILRSWLFYYGPLFSNFHILD